MSSVRFILFHTSIRLQHSTYSKKTKNWWLQKRYRQKEAHWHYILIIFNYVNKLQTHLSYGHYHKYNNYYWSALHDPAKLRNDDRLGCIYELPYPFVTFNMYSSNSLYSTAYNRRRRLDQTITHKLPWFLGRFSNLQN